MGNYNDFLRVTLKEGAQLRRLYWIYGEEEMFRVLTVRQIKETAAIPSSNITHISAFDTPETEVWAMLNQHPLDTKHMRLLIVHDAQRLTHLERLDHWLKDSATVRAKSATVVFVSSESVISEEVEVITRRSSAMLVKCALPQNEDDRMKRVREIITRWGPINSVEAGVLAERVNYDMAEAYAVVQKAAVFPNAQLTVKAINLLAPRRADDDLVNALLACSRRRAVEALPDVPEASVSRIIGSLSTHVEALSRINSTLTSGLSMRETAKRLNLKEGYVRMLHPYAKSFPRKKAVRRILLLNRMDAAWQSGAREGVLETLVASW